MGKNLFIINANTLDEFITELSLPVNLEKLIKLLNKYDILDITEVNYPSLKIKNIIICKYKN